MSTKKTKKSSLLFTLGTAVLLVAGGGAAYWFLNQRTTGPLELPVGAAIIPQNAMMAVSVSTDSNQWKRLRTFGTPQSQAAFDQSLVQLRDRILTANGYDYEKDIKPWVGKDVTIAFVSPQATPPTQTTPNPAPVVPQQQATLVVLPIQNPLQAKQLLEKPKQSTGKIVERTYQGFQIRETQGSPTQNFSATVLDGKFLVVTTDPKATDRAIDTYKGGPALAATPGLTQALRKIQAAQPFGTVYVNLPAAAAATSAGRPNSAQALAQVQQNQGLAATVSLESEGIRFKGVSWLKPDSQRKYTVQNSAKSMSSRLPADTLIMASGGNLKKFWQDYTQGAAANPVSPINPEALRAGLKSTVGMDLDKDFLSWMDGEFALSLVGTPEGGAPGLPFSLVFMAQASDRRAAEKMLKQLDQAMATKYSFKVENSKVGNQPVTNWTPATGGLSVTHGWMDGNTAFLTMGAPITPSLIPKPAASLADSDLFKQTVPTEPAPNNGHFFVNVDRAINGKSLPLFPLPPASRELVAAIRSIGVTAAVSDERSTRYDAFVMLQKAGAPKPLPSPTLPSGIPSPGSSGTPGFVLPPALPEPSTVPTP